MRAVWLVALLALMPTAQAAPFLMHGVDAQGTGHVLDPGPATQDVAYVLEIPPVDERPQMATLDSPVVILNGSAFFVSQTALSFLLMEAPVPEQVGPAVVWRLDLWNATLAVLDTVPTSWSTGTIASDGRIVVMAGARDVRAWNPDGTPAWQAPIPLTASDEVYDCRAGLFDGPTDRFVFPCWVEPVQRDPNGNPVVRIADDVAPGARLEMISFHSDASGFWSAPVAVGPDGVPWYSAPGDVTASRRPVVVGETLIYATQTDRIPTEACGSAVPYDRALGGFALTVQGWALDTGEPRFHAFQTTPWLDDAQAAGNGEERRLSEASDLVHLLSDQDGVLVLSSWGIHRLHLPRCEWERFVYAGDMGTEPTQQPNLARDETAVYAVLGRTLHAYDRITWRLLWDPVELPGGGPAARDLMLVTQDGIYTQVSNTFGSVHRLSLTDGSAHLLLASEYSSRGRLAIGDGYLVHRDGNRIVTVMGPSAAAIGLAPQPVNLYPPLHAPFQVDVSTTTPGRFGTSTSYDVDWGDGQASSRRPGPLLEHTYSRDGDFLVTVTARNAAGQTATTTFVVHPGQDPPVPPSFLQTAFDAEHQELSFFILGLAATLLFAIFGLVRHRRRHGILRREMQEIESVYNRNRDDPFRCEEKLDHERSRLRTLFLDRHLDDGQYALLKDRVDELARLTRLGVVDQGFGFLPVAIANTLRGMLDDGRITEWERSMFVDAIERDDQLVAEYKRKVVRLVDDWFRRDARKAKTAD